LAETVAAELRSSGINVAIDYSGRKLGKQIKTADTHGIPYALFLGDDKHGLKDLKSGNQVDLNVAQIADHLNR
jgi:histidyl-tRNA synthetase